MGGENWVAESVVETLVDDANLDLAIVEGYVQMRTETLFSHNRDFVFLQVR